MQYRNDKKGTPVSLLGYGCMRFTRKGQSIDIDKAQRELEKAIELGVNYFDTAYVYPGSEAALGEILERLGCREKVMIATKLPHYLIKSKAGIEKTFNEELKRLKTDYVDYYLMHMLTDTDTWEKMKSLGILEWIEEKKRSGKIRNIGFSYHGNTEMFIKLLDAYDWDFCQIQYNYLDEHTQAGRRGLEYAGEKGVPVIIMEPLRGGRLVNLLPQSAKDIIANYDVKRSPAEWALRWLWEQPQVTCILSGMNSLEMVEENCRVASEVKVNEFTPKDYELIEKVKTEINKSMRVGCTGCGYCLPCPKGVDIPMAFMSYNFMLTQDKRGTKRSYMQCTIFRKNTSSASQCVGCGKCEKHCPQGIEIRKELKNAAAELEDWKYKIAKKVIRLFRLW
jgi:hypothetical protein